MEKIAGRTCGREGSNGKQSYASRTSRFNLELDPTGKPVRQTEAASATIFPLREMVSKEIKKQLEMNILKRVTDDAMGCQHRTGHEKGEQSPWIVVDKSCPIQGDHQDALPHTHIIEELNYEMNGAPRYSLS